MIRSCKIPVRSYQMFSGFHFFDLGILQLFVVFRNSGGKTYETRSRTCDELKLRDNPECR